VRQYHVYAIINYNLLCIQVVSLYIYLILLYWWVRLRFIRNYKWLNMQIHTFYFMNMSKYRIKKNLKFYEVSYNVLYYIYIFKLIEDNGYNWVFYNQFLILVSIINALQQFFITHFKLEPFFEINYLNFILNVIHK